jgi:hypothetical protein
VSGNDFGRIFVDADNDRNGLTGAQLTPSWVFDLPRYSQKAMFESYGPGLVYNTLTAAFTEGLVITGATSKATAVITATFPDTVAAASGTLYLTNVTGAFADGETVADTGGGSAKITRCTYKYNNAIIRMYGVGGQEVRTDAKRLVFDRWGAFDLFCPMRMFTWDTSLSAASDPESLSCFAQEGFAYVRTDGGGNALKVYLNGAWRTVNVT